MTPIDSANDQNAICRDIEGRMYTSTMKTRIKEKT